MSKLIEIFLIDNKVNAAIVKLIRSINPLFSISDINCRVKTKTAIFARELKKEKFYSGVDEVLSVVDLLERNNVGIKINVNGGKIDKTYLLAIKDKVSHISLENFR